MQLVKQSWTVGSGSNAADYAESYTYNEHDGKLQSITTKGGKVQTLAYDGMRRLSFVENDVYKKTYSYNYTDGRTTNQVSTQKYTELEVPLTYDYTYDEETGNILTIDDPLQGDRSYDYDEQGQMIKEVIGDTEYEYEYDNVGNITKTLTNGIVTHTYTYGHASWDDRLMAYDNVGFEYDAIGNTTTENIEIASQRKQLRGIMHCSSLYGQYKNSLNGSKN